MCWELVKTLKRNRLAVKGNKDSSFTINLFLVCFRFNIFIGCPQSKTCTIIMRGGAEQFMAETERSLHDAIMIVRRAIKNDAIVAGIPTYILSILILKICKMKCTQNLPIKITYFHLVY